MLGHEEKGNTDEYKRLAKCLAGSAVLGIILTLIILLAISFAISSNKLPAGLSRECVIMAAFAGAAAAGAATVKQQGRGALLTGVYAGVMMLIITKVLALLLPGGAVTGDSALKTAICCIAGGAFGGALGMQRKTKKLTRRKR